MPAFLILGPKSFRFFRSAPDSQRHSMSRFWDAISTRRATLFSPGATSRRRCVFGFLLDKGARLGRSECAGWLARSEEHTSELQSLTNLVCRLLLEKKKNNTRHIPRAYPK